MTRLDATHHARTLLPDPSSYLDGHFPAGLRVAPGFSSDFNRDQHGSVTK